MREKRRACPRRGGQVLILLAGALFLGGATVVTGAYLTGLDIKDLDKAVKRTVDDNGREKAARETIETWKKDGAAFEERFGKREESVLKLLKSGTTDRAAIDAILAEQDVDTDAILKRTLDHRFALRAELTTAEWIEIFGTGD